MSDGICCWWCCHPFPGPSLHFPYKYDQHRKHFTTIGHFCTWECMKAYGIEQGITYRSEFIALFRKHAQGGVSISCLPAPKRPALRMFGGTLTIEEFRQGSSNVIVTMPWETHVMPTVATTHRAVQYQQQPVSQNQETSLVLKRNKPLQREKSSLESSLGIIRRKAK